MKDGGEPMPLGTKKVDEAQLRIAVETLYANIRFAEVDDPIHTIAVTSALPGEGKTTVAVELARTMAGAGRRVLLVECDLRHRCLAGRLGVHGSERAGLCSVALGTVSVADAVAAVGPGAGLWLLDAEPNVPTATEVLGSRRFGTLVRELGQAWDYVVLDTPPLAAVVDAALVGAVADATLLVVRAGFVPRTRLVEARDQLLKAGANVIGTVMNCCEGVPSERYERYYRPRTHGAAGSAAAAPRGAGSSLGAHGA